MATAEKKEKLFTIPTSVKIAHAHEHEKLQLSIWKEKPMVLEMVSEINRKNAIYWQSTPSVLASIPVSNCYEATKGFMSLFVFHR